MMELQENRTASLAGRIWEIVRKYPGYPALEKGDRQFSYKELYQAAAPIAQAIIDLDNPNPFVAVMADKSFACYAGILGILMAGKAYLPLNPRFPAARNLYMLEKARIRVALAGDDSDDELDQVFENYREEIFLIFPEETGELQNTRLVPKIVSPDDPAYLLFTSGTTGIPKGVPVSNGNVCSYLDQMLHQFDFRTDDRFTQIFDLTFDLSVHDIFLAWSAGACLVVPEDNSSFAMSRFIREKQPTVWFSVPSVVNLIDRMRLLKPGAFPSIRQSFFCGEALQVKTALAWKTAADKSRLVNLYGPTEATIAISSYELPDEIGNWKMEIGIVSIGKVFERNSYSIDKANPGDETGELCLAGHQVVNGYFENEEADKAAFFEDKETKQKFYRTGDLVKADHDGDLFFLGRTDAEVKVSGYRVNLKEIENVIEGYDPVKQAVVIYENTDDSTGDIMAFILTGTDDDPTSEKALDNYIREYLPWYMVPGKFIFVSEIPLNVNGKVDKAALLKNYNDGK
jgi:amino acid adenylation domain-containing protein